MIKQFIKILVNHKGAILLAILVGMIMAFPQAYFVMIIKIVTKELI